MSTRRGLDPSGSGSSRLTTLVGAPDADDGDMGPALLHDDTCAYTIRPRTTRTRCQEPRSCRSCLRKAGCMVDAWGACVQQLGTDGRRRYDPAMDFTQAALWNKNRSSADGNRTENATAQRWHFRALKARYCAATDPVCLGCIANDFWRPEGSSPDSRFCLGTGGCLCIDNCEQTPVMTKDNDNCSGFPVPVASSPAPTDDCSSSSSTVDLGTWLAIGSGLLVVTCIATLLWGFRRRSDRHDSTRGERARTTPSLGGWRAQREALIISERRVLAGNDDHREIR